MYRTEKLQNHNIFFQYTSFFFDVDENLIKSNKMTQVEPAQTS